MNNKEQPIILNIKNIGDSEDPRSLAGLNALIEIGVIPRINLDQETMNWNLFLEKRGYDPEQPHYRHLKF
jgi:hypothetical protein